MKSTAAFILLASLQSGSVFANCWKNTVTEKTAGESFNIASSSLDAISRKIVDIEIHVRIRDDAGNLQSKKYAASGFFADIPSHADRSKRYLLTTQGIVQMALQARYLDKQIVKILTADGSTLEKPFAIEALSRKQNIALISIDEERSVDLGISISKNSILPHDSSLLVIPSCSYLTHVEKLSQKIAGEKKTYTTPVSLGESYLANIHAYPPQRGSPVFNNDGKVVGLLSDTLQIKIKDVAHAFSIVESFTPLIDELSTYTENPNEDAMNTEQKEFWEGFLSFDIQEKVDHLINHLKTKDPLDYRAMYLASQIALNVDPEYALQLLGSVQTYYRNDFLTNRQIVLTLRKLGKETDASTQESWLRQTYPWYDDLHGSVSNQK